jgi:hypothetical protein
VEEHDCLRRVTGVTSTQRRQVLIVDDPLWLGPGFRMILAVTSAAGVPLFPHWRKCRHNGLSRAFDDADVKPLPVRG